MMKDTIQAPLPCGERGGGEGQEPAQCLSQPPHPQPFSPRGVFNDTHHDGFLAREGFMGGKATNPASRIV